MEGSSPYADQHLVGLANLLAQAEAFARGHTLEAAQAELAAKGKPPAEVARLAPHKVHPGNHPSNILLLRRLDPHSLGFLIALYEHKVFVQACIWGINPFDQWGVELGKGLAIGMHSALQSATVRGSPGRPGDPGLDPGSLSAGSRTGTRDRFGCLTAPAGNLRRPFRTLISEIANENNGARYRIRGPGDGRLHRPGRQSRRLRRY